MAWVSKCTLPIHAATASPTIAPKDEDMLMSLTVGDQPKRQLQGLLDGLIGMARSLRLGGRHRSDGEKVEVPGRNGVARLEATAHRLLSERGHGAGTRLAAAFIEGYQSLLREEREVLLSNITRAFAPDTAKLTEACRAYLDEPGPAALRTLARRTEAPRQELFRRINQAPLATFALVKLRADLLDALPRRPELKDLDDDLAHLFHSWFNRGFLVMRRIDWSCPAELLEKIISYEAVHSIGSWQELRRRLYPVDRRCYAFFHPALLDEPLIFVEVALSSQIEGSIQAILANDRTELSAADAKVAVFYSISNCQRGLKGVSFGHHLIQQVVEDLSHELPGLETFVTLSPVPGFGRWVHERRQAGDSLAAELVARAAADPQAVDDAIVPLAVRYFNEAKDSHGRPIDPVARFHLGNGARLERICPGGDMSPAGRERSFGLMVNYRYDLDTLELNRDGFAKSGTVVWGEPARAMLNATLTANER
jgi:malonyl-CoA decarboxylase